MINTVDWADCQTPDCEYKVCLWAGVGLFCYLCSVQMVGKAEMQRRYAETHDRLGQWNGFVAAEQK